MCPTKKGLGKSEAPFFTVLPELLANGSYVNKRLAVCFLVEAYGTINECEEGVVFTHTYVLTRIVNSTPLTDENVASFCKLTAEQFYAESFALRLTAVL